MKMSSLHLFLPITTALALCLTTQAQNVAAAESRSDAPRPSFNCASPENGVDRAICIDTALAGIDVAIAHRYRILLGILDAKGAAALRQDQRDYQRAVHAHLGRSRTGDLFSDEYGELQERMEARRSFLERIIAKPSPDLTGQWENSVGIVRIVEKPDGKLTVDAEDFYASSCAAYGAGEADGDRIVANDPFSGEPIIAVERNRSILRLALLPPDAIDQYCSAGNRRDGAYFRVTETIVP